jgi:hypothetical protein
MPVSRPALPRQYVFGVAPAEIGESASKGRERSDGCPRLI